MERIATQRTRVIDLTPYLEENRRSRRRDQLYTVLALRTQQLSAAVLALYGLLRLTVCRGVPVGQYSGPLSVLWPTAFFLLLTSYVSDRLLWQEEPEMRRA